MQFRGGWYHKRTNSRDLLVALLHVRSLLLVAGGTGGHHVLGPLGAGDGVDVEHVHGVNLLQAAVLALHQEEEDDEDKGSAAAGEDETVQVADRVGDEAGEEAHQKVPEPVAGSGNGHGRSAVLGRVELGRDDPDKRTPGGGEGGDEQAREHDEDVAGRGRVGWVDGVKLEATNKRVDEEAHHHPEGATHESISSSTLLDNVETAKGATNVDGTENDLGNVAVAKTGGTEDGGTVVEEEVGTRQLLTSLTQS